MRYRSSDYIKTDYADDLALASNLVKNGVASDQVRKIFKNRIDQRDLDDLLGEGRGVHEHARGVHVEPDIKRLVEEMKAPDDFIDPLYQHLMKDPVVLSTGLVLDRSSIIDQDGKLRFSRCPFSGEELRNDIYPVSSKREAIANFKARRDRNVNEIARKLIASGEYRSFVDILDAVESYVKGRGDNYLSLAREIAAVWTGVREASNMMLLVENLELDGTVNRWVPVVEAGGLHDKVFKIIVSSEVFRSYAGRAGQNKISLSLWDENGIFVERCRLFDYAVHERRSHYHHQMFGRRDPIVSKARPGFSYRLEYMVGSGSAHLEVSGMMCKIFAEASKRSSYRMRDAYDKEGIFIGPIDRQDSAHGVGLLEYDDGKSFVGKFYQGSMAEGVLYRGAHAHRTLIGGKWTHSIDERIVQKYPGNMLVYDCTTVSRSRNENHLGGMSEYENSTTMGSDRAQASVSHYGPRHASNYDRRSGARDSRTGMLVNPHDTDVSELGFYDHGSKKYYRDIEDANRHHQRSTVRVHKEDTDITELPIHALPVFQSIQSRHQPDHEEERASNMSGKYKSKEDSFIDKRREVMKMVEEDIEFEKEGRISSRGEMPSMHARSSNHRIQKRTVDEHDLEALLKMGNKPGSISGRAQSQGNAYDYDKGRRLDTTGSDSLLGKIGSKSDDQDSLAQLQRDLDQMQRPHTTGKSFEQDDLDALRKEFDKVQHTPHRVDHEALRQGLEGRDGRKSSSLGMIPERNPSTTRSSRMSPGKKAMSLGLLPEEEEFDGYDRRDAMDGPRNRDISSSSQRRIRNIVMVVDNMVTPSKGGSWKKILKSGSLQDGVSSIIVSADAFQDMEGTSNLAITLYNARDQVIARQDLFGHPPKEGMLAPTLYTFIERDEHIVSRAASGCYYQLEYSVGSGLQNAITVRGLVCKIIPKSNTTPSYEMCDPEGHKGRFMGALNVNGDAHGSGRLEYENGNTFVGEFQTGKLHEGAYYRGNRFMFSMTDGKWTEVPVPAFQKKYPHNIQMHAKLQTTNSKSITYANVDKENVDSSTMCCF